MKMNYNKMQFCRVLILCLLAIGCQTTNPEDSVNATLWLTTPNQQALLEKLEDRILIGDSSSGNPLIEVNPTVTFQEMDGFGFTLTGGSALHLANMNSADRLDILNELFGQDVDEIGISYLRVSIGASDLDPAPFSYNDLPQGETDIALANFSVDPDREYLIPVLKEILTINPEIKILGSPWSAPVWMKDNNSTIGGSLQPKYYQVYADYFVKYINSMAEEGITIDAITIQNEPLHDGNNPSMAMSAAQQLGFIKNNLGPTFKNENIKTKIILYDHNADRPEYPISILNDLEAREYIDGSAFHLYGGDISALSSVHDAHPDKNLYFTEQWIGAPGNFASDIKWHTKNLIIGATRNWSRNVLQWNLAADQNQDPHTVGGCDRCLGGITIQGNSVTKNPAFYIIAHASKFVRPGSIRIESNVIDGLPNVAFLTPNKEIVLIILNDSNSSEEIDISIDNKLYSFSLSAGAVSTLVFDRD